MNELEESERERERERERGERENEDLGMSHHRFSKYVYYRAVVLYAELIEKNKLCC